MENDEKSTDNFAAKLPCFHSLIPLVSHRDAEREGGGVTRCRLTSTRTRSAHEGQDCDKIPLHALSFHTLPPLFFVSCT